MSIQVFSKLYLYLSVKLFMHFGRLLTKTCAIICHQIFYLSYLNDNGVVRIYDNAVFKRGQAFVIPLSFLMINTSSKDMIYLFIVYFWSLLSAYVWCGFYQIAYLCNSISACRSSSSILKILGVRNMSCFLLRKHWNSQKLKLSVAKFN